MDDVCNIYMFVLAMVLLGDLAIFLFIPRIIGPRKPDHLAAGAEPRATRNPVLVIRVSIVLSMLLIIGMFSYLLNTHGCLG